MSKYFGAGDLKERAAFDKRVDREDGLGNTVAEWEEQFSVRAGYMHLRGGEAVMASRLENRHPQVIRIRASSQARSITAEWRCRDTRTGNVFAIRDVTHTTDRKWVDLLCERGTAA